MSCCGSLATPDFRLTGFSNDQVSLLFNSEYPLTASPFSSNPSIDSNQLKRHVIQRDGIFIADKKQTTKTFIHDIMEKKYAEFSQQ